MSFNSKFSAVLAYLIALAAKADARIFLYTKSVFAQPINPNENGGGK
ncbi:hypothetical protein [Bartonella sp. HY406]|nr:hypothetical protein [Bartonella sp. HY406]UXN05098.1 hypothetical protein N6B01_15005 [Bartonella sp. HY406]